MLITISGVPGSGKTTVGKLLSQSLGLPHIYAGDVYRQQAQQRGLTLEQLNELAESDHTIDRALDDRMADYAKQGNAVLEGRLAAFVCLRAGVDAFKVWLTASDEVRAKRVAERENQDSAAVLQQNTARHGSDSRRYKSIYGWDLNDTAVYDLILASDDRTPESLAAEIRTAALEHFRLGGK